MQVNGTYGQHYLYTFIFIVLSADGKRKKAGSNQNYMQFLYVRECEPDIMDMRRIEIEDLKPITIF